MTDPAKIWSATLDNLQLQMTKDTFHTHLGRSRVLAADNSDTEWTICVTNVHSAEWLTHRLAHKVEAALAGQLGHPAKVRFAAEMNGPHPSPPAPQHPSTSAPQHPTAPAPTIERDFAQIDYRWLWKKTGFVMASDYAAKFWQPLLGSRAYALWLYVQAENKEASLWTRPRRFSIRRLSRTLRIGTASITGGLRPCHLAEKQKLLGEPLRACCDRYQPTAWDYETRAGEKQCLHWNPGALEELYNAHLLGIRIEEGDNPRAHKMQLQVWTVLPLITPGQAAQLSEVDQLHHDRWLERYGHLAKIEPGRWSQIAGPSLVPLMAGHANYELTDPYQPNPLEADDV